MRRRHLFGHQLADNEDGISKGGLTLLVQLFLSATELDRLLAMGTLYSNALQIDQEAKLFLSGQSTPVIGGEEQSPLL